MLPEEIGLMMLWKCAQVNRVWKENVEMLFDPGRKWQKRRAVVMQVGDAQLKTLLRQLDIIPVSYTGLPASHPDAMFTSRSVYYRKYCSL